MSMIMNDNEMIILVVDDERNHADGIVEALEKLCSKAIAVYNGQDAMEIIQSRKKARRSGKAAVKNSMKFAGDRTEVFKLMGVYYWIIGKQKKALIWWNKSINVGEQLGAHPELARTYMEVGKRLREQKSKYEQLNGIQAEEYLGKARALFQEMELEWDLEQLDKITGDLSASIVTHSKL